MIDFLRGSMVYRGTDYIAIEVGGVGYQVTVTNPFSYEEQESIFLYTHQVVREDAHLLYGFQTTDERDLFRLLLEVSGIGPKAGIAILAGGTPRQIVSAIQLEDLKFLTALPGIGKKTAQRIVLDLKDKLQKLGWDRRFQLTLSLPDQMVEPPIRSATDDDHHMRDVVEALTGLGYHEEEARLSVRKARESTEKELSTGEWIRLALQMSVKR
ncbi:Holliday junction branch migration protein RuvA [Thermoactinomyces sp. DSM 45892]|uniref:Holliday junction branch migration protein RuvA n=1 Tax=Thermoactinomyces sp. DSM 45892 TaxID=1882753 RepID=UPI00089AAE4B|nr:Holliday junction branch migration protein RuvA [Thermoactinomyces sp. DSM 45892]SDY03612.1 Holliday junction DNA helicase subunit RuvA [Thermoactinomyces sp. DSM 45892]